MAGKSRSDTVVVHGAVGCMEHLQFRHPETKEWIKYTIPQMAAIRKVYAYCKLEFKVIYYPCPECYPNNVPEGATYV